MKRLAVIGASTGQLPLVKKAKELGIKTYCFAWDNGAICKDYCDEFFPISIYDTEKIVVKCKELDIDGVVTNASEETALATANICAQLKLNTTDPQVISLVQNKGKVREITKDIMGLSVPSIYRLEDRHKISYPCVVKPIKGSAKKGVSFCKTPDELDKAIEYAKEYGNEILIEEYINGLEYSVEAISYHGKHQIIQITRKVTSGYPHFVELEHHQPAQLPAYLAEKVKNIVSKILSKVGFTDGASHTEIKIDGERIFLIEINPRGGGDRISDTLTSSSTDCDYLKEMIMVAMDEFQFTTINNTSYSGILFLNLQNKRILKYFDNPNETWIVEMQKDSEPLRESISNYDRNGFIIYNSKTPLNL